MRRWLGFGYGCLLMVAAGCGAADGPTSGWPVVRDSAGVQIVEVGPLDERVAFRVGAEPDYVLGWEPGDYPFQCCVRGVLLSDGRAAVLDGGAQEVVVLLPFGVVESVLGGRGDGPGEFSGVLGIATYGADTIVTQEAFRRRFTFFHEGEETRTLSFVDLPTAPIYQAIGIDDRARMILQPSSSSIGFPEPWLREPVLRVDLGSGDLDTLRVFDYRQNSSLVPGLIAPTGTVGFTGSGVVIGRSDQAQIEMVDFEGHTTRIVRWEDAQPDITDAFWAAYNLGYAEVRPGLSESELSQRLDEMADRRDRTHYLPHFGRRLVSDDLGNVWVPEFGPDSRFDRRYRVFSSQGEWMGWVHMPDRFQALDIRDGRMLGVHLDQFSVPAVAVYRLEE